MRNLRNIAHGVFRDPDSCSAPAISASCWDAASNEVIVARGPTADDARIELLRLAHGPASPHL